MKIHLWKPNFLEFNKWIINKSKQPTTIETVGQPPEVTIIHLSTGILLHSFWANCSEFQVWMASSPDAVFQFLPQMLNLRDFYQKWRDSSLYCFLALLGVSTYLCFDLLSGWKNLDESLDFKLSDTRQHISLQTTFITLGFLCTCTNVT